MKNEPFTPIKLFRDDPRFPEVCRAYRAALWYRWFDALDAIPAVAALGTLAYLYVLDLERTLGGGLAFSFSLMLGYIVATAARTFSSFLQQRRYSAAHFAKVCGLVGSFDSRLTDFNALAPNLALQQDVHFAEDELLREGAALARALEQALRHFNDSCDPDVVRRMMRASESETPRG